MIKTKQFLVLVFYKNKPEELIMIDRGFVQMVCDRKEICGYKLPHYHCVVCGNQVNSDELRRDYHPCCSAECIIIYNQQNPTFVN